MKTVKTIALSLLLGLSSSVALATNQATPPTAEPTPITQQAEQKVTVNPNSININTASAAEIQDKLVGIGAKKAQAIIEYREKNGPFVNIEQLTEVSGIGKATLEKNRDRVVLE
ncbi:transporter [Pasteurellaceae bacterium LFhippo2]|nr:transporter [Pasteurellaceae bacterium LFhippo2]